MKNIQTTLVLTAAICFFSPLTLLGEAPSARMQLDFTAEQSERCQSARTMEQWKAYCQRAIESLGSGEDQEAILVPDRDPVRQPTAIGGETPQSLKESPRREFTPITVPEFKTLEPTANGFMKFERLKAWTDQRLMELFPKHFDKKKKIADYEEDIRKGELLLKKAEEKAADARNLLAEAEKDLSDPDNREAAEISRSNIQRAFQAEGVARTLIIKAKLALNKLKALDLSNRVLKKIKGEKEAKEFVEDSGGEVKNHKQQARINSIADRLSKGFPEDGPMKVKILNGVTVKSAAVALANGEIYIEAAYLSQNPRPSDNEIAFLLSHEMAHQKLRHADQHYSVENYYGNHPPEDIPNDAVARKAGRAGRAHFTQPNELEADVLAIHYMKKGKFDIRGAGEAYRRMGPSGPARDPIYGNRLSSHPLAEDRIEAVESVWGRGSLRL